MVKDACAIDTHRLLLPAAQVVDGRRHVGLELHGGEAVAAVAAAPAADGKVVWRATRKGASGDEVALPWSIGQPGEGMVAKCLALLLEQHAATS